MGAENEEAPERELNTLPPSNGWKNRILIPTLLAGVAGAGTGLISKHRKSLGLANITASYAANFAIVTGCYCGAREFVTETRKTGPDDLWNSSLWMLTCDHYVPSDRYNGTSFANAFATSITFGAIVPSP
ncbi:hypothetical protein Ahy_B10g104941 [Arachis hypogaea]|uniref:Uncharacterized protein n=1 Tax=Arachis hypogaea TaxID=3818 RepID=A0A444X6R3_ARAHY|nr:hypothetical protein Ahy_B10g104941 [Arachis hypogaea]